MIISRNIDTFTSRFRGRAHRRECRAARDLRRGRDPSKACDVSGLPAPATDDEKTYFAFSGVRNPLDVAVTRYVHVRANSKEHFSDPHEVALRNSLASRLERRIYAWVQRNDATFEEFLERWYVVPYDTGRASTTVEWISSSDSRPSPRTSRKPLGRSVSTPVRPLPVVNATPERGRDFLSYYTPRARRRAVWVFGPYMEDWGYAFPADWGSPSVPWWSRVVRGIVRVPRAVYWRFFRFGDYVKRRPGGMAPIPRD